MTRWLSLLAVIQICLAAVLGGLWLTSRHDDTMAVGVDQAVDPALRPLTIESGYGPALQRAQTWHPDAVLFAVSLQVDWPLTVDPAAETNVAAGGWIAYTFAWPEHAVPTPKIKQTLSLFYERTTGALMSAKEVTWPRSPVFTPLDFDEILVKSQTALIAVELKSGTSWRAECPENRHLSRVGLTTFDGRMTWVITFEDQRTRAAGLVARVDSESGDLVAIDDRSTPCDADGAG